MKFIIREQLKDNIYNLMRRTGYSFERKEEATGELAFARPARGYPRFHLFITISEKEGVILNLHLDQKKPSYEGAAAHSGEYNTDIVEKEAERIKYEFQK